MRPLHLLLITVGVVFVAELLSMVGFETLWGVPEAVEAGLDILVLSLVVVPLLYLALYRPLNRYVAQLESTAEALRYSEEKYQTLVEHAPVGLFIHRGGRIVFANRRMYTMFTCAASTLVDADPFASDEHIRQIPEGWGARYLREVRVLEGRLAETLLRVAREIGADLIVMGAHRHTTVGELLVGSTAHGLIQHSPVPVLMVRVAP